MMLSLALALVALASPAPPASPAASPLPVTRPLPTGPVVTLVTSVGVIKLALDPVKSPLSTANFLQYVRAKHYDGTIFHRVIPGFMAQGGNMDESLNERDTRAPIKNEAANGRRNLRGTVAMARTDDPHSATAQFFVNLKDNAFLDAGRGAGYAVFGEVIEGMDVVDRMATVPTGDRNGFQNVPLTPIVIKTATASGRTRPAAAGRPKPGTRPVRRTPRPPAPKP